jgi:hypothetical protein
MAYVQTYDSLVNDVTTYTNQGSNQVFAATLPQIILFAQRRIARELKILGLEKYVLGTFTTQEGVIPKPTLWLSTNSIRFGGKSGVAYATEIINGGSGYLTPPTVTGGNLTAFQAFVQGGMVTQIGIVNGGAQNTQTFALTITAAPNDLGTGATANGFAYSGNNVSVPILERTYEFCRFYWPDATQTADPEFYCDYGYDNWLFAPTPSASLPIEIAYQAIAEPLDETHQTNWLTNNAPDLLFNASMLQAFTFLKDPGQIQIWQGVYNDAKVGFAVEDDGRAIDRSVAGPKPAMAPPAGPGG